MKSGKFIVIEGLEGAGKTTARDTVVDELKRWGIENVRFTREPERLWQRSSALWLKRVFMTSPLRIKLNCLLCIHRGSSWLRMSLNLR